MDDSKKRTLLGEDGKFVGDIFMASSYTEGSNEWFMFMFYLKPTVNEFTGESTATTITDFIKSPDLSKCYVISYRAYFPKNRVLKVSSGKVKEITNSNGFTFRISENARINQKHLTENLRGSRVFDLPVLLYSKNLGILDTDIESIIYRGQNLTQSNNHKGVWYKYKDKSIYLIHNESFEFSGYKCKITDRLNPKSHKWFYVPINWMSKNAEFDNLPEIPTSFTETENVIEFNYANGDYFKVSKLKDNKIFDARLHGTNGLLRVSSKDNSILTEYDFTDDGVLSGALGYTVVIPDDMVYNEAMASNAVDFLNTPFENQWSDMDVFEQSIEHRAATWRWYKTDTKEEGEWYNYALHTKSELEAIRNHNSVAYKQRRDAIISRNNKQYGALNVQNVMKGIIKVGMPWELVKKAFANAVFEESSYATVYKLINNIPEISIEKNDIVLSEYGFGKFVYVTVKNGKVTSVTYTNHR